MRRSGKIKGMNRSSAAFTQFHDEIKSVQDYLIRLRAEVFNLAWGDRKLEIEALMDEMKKHIEWRAEAL